MKQHFLYILHEICLSKLTVYIFRLQPTSPKNTIFQNKMWNVTVEKPMRIQAPLVLRSPHSKTWQMRGDFSPMLGKWGSLSLPFSLVSFLYTQIEKTVKGTVSRDFCLLFFHPTASYGPNKECPSKILTTQCVLYGLPLLLREQSLKKLVIKIAGIFLNPITSNRLQLITY